MTVERTQAAQTRPPRDRMVRTAAQLIRRKGVSGTGMREIVIEAGAPRGSLQHYFPGGKDELVSEALGWMGTVAARRVSRHLEGLDRADKNRPSVLLNAIVDDWRRDLADEGYTAGCPLLAAAADTAASNEQIRGVLRVAFDAWEGQLTAALVQLGVPAERAGGLASFAISSLEGAIVLARIRRVLDPLNAIVKELGPILDAAVTSKPRKRTT